MGKSRVIFASIIGTALEFYDFMLFAVFSESIGHVFFPPGVISDFQSGWLTFIVAYLSRPFGATLFGYIGDKYGRKFSLILTVSCMGIPTFIIGVMPGYETLGITATIILFISRLIQGLCTGGEYNGSAIFTLEHVGKNLPGFAGGLITGASVIGALGAVGVGVLVTNDAMPDWYRRIAFINGALVSLVGLYIRLFVEESPAYQALQEEEGEDDSEEKSGRSPLLVSLKKHSKSVRLSIAIGFLNGTLSYTLYKFINLYLQNLGMAKHDTLLYTNIGIIVFIFGSPTWGYIMDKIGYKRMMMIACCLAMGLAVPIFFLLQTLNPWMIGLAQVLMGLCVASIAGPEHAFIQRLFPTQDRFSGVAFSFSTGMGLGAGVSPLVMKVLVEKTGMLLLPSIVMIFAGLVLFILLKRYKGPYYDL
jgi:MHS family proline/betaine transporter-like MFS transporter